MFTHQAAATRDFSAIEALADICEMYDHLNRPLRIADLTASLREEDPALDWRLWHAEDNELVAFARVRLTNANNVVEGRCWLYIHPSRRAQGLEDVMIAWVAVRVQQAAQSQGIAQYRLMTGVRSDQQDRLGVLARHDFQPIRYFFTMRRSLAEPLPTPNIPAGFVIRPVDAGQDIPAYVALGNAAFAEHWNHHDETVAGMQALMGEPGYRTDLDLLAIAPDGTLVGFCTCTLEDIFVQQGAGFVLGLGTHPQFRGRGLGRALLLAGLQRLRALGLQSAAISVDAQNPTGAVKLYESVGFVTYETWIMQSKAGGNR